MFAELHKSLTCQFNLKFHTSYTPGNVEHCVCVAYLKKNIMALSLALVMLSVPITSTLEASEMNSYDIK